MASQHSASDNPAAPTMPQQVDADGPAAPTMRQQIDTDGPATPAVSHDGGGDLSVQSVDNSVATPSSQPAPAAEERTRVCDAPEGVEARVDLYHSHAFMKVDALLQSFNEGFAHADFDRIEGNDLLTDEYDNGRFHVIYCLHESGRDELRVRWSKQLEVRPVNDNELLGLARQLAHLLGGGTNLRLIDERSGGRKRGSYKD